MPGRRRSNNSQLADQGGQLSGADLESLALAAFFAARADAALDVKERAFKAYLAEGNDLRAAFLAIDVARTYGFQGKNSIAAAWGSRAAGIIGPEGETYAHGYLALGRSEGAAATGDVDTALALAELAVAIGTRVADADLKASALTNLGSLKIAAGSTFDGFALMEEASIAAVNGELSPMTTGVTACRMIGACRDMTDYRRASEWIEATEKYCDRQSLSGFPGVCRIHRAEVAAVGGAWVQAEQELERATIELGAYNATPPQADGYYAIGDIRRLKGDFEGAQQALREAHARGKSPQPALALVRLAEGNVKAASSAINAAVAEETWDRWARARLLPAQVEIAIAAGDVAGARTAVDSLGEIVADYPSPAFESGRQVALARVLLAEGDASGAIRELRPAIKGWRDVGAPYEVARARAILSRALRAVEDADGADLELEAALASFVQLGARVDMEAAERELRDATDRRSGPQTATKTFMFTDIVGSTTLAEALGDQAWEAVLRNHDDMLRARVAAARRGGRQLHRGRFLRRLRRGPRGDRLRDRDPAGVARPARQGRLRMPGADRTPHGGGEPARQRLQREGRPRGGPGRCSRRGRRDPGQRGDDRGGREGRDLGTANRHGQGRGCAGDLRRDHLELSPGTDLTRVARVVCWDAPVRA